MLVAHHARALEHHQLGAVAAAQQRLGGVHFAGSLQFLHEQRARGRIPVERGGARQRVDLLGAAVKPSSLTNAGLTASTLPAGENW